MKYLAIFAIFILFSFYQTADSEWTDYNTHDPGISQSKIPAWIKNNAEWWSEGLIGDKDFLSGIQYLVDKNIITVDAKTQSNPNTLPFVPNWIKDTAGWWSAGRVSDADFVNGLTWLIENGVIIVESQTKLNDIETSSMTKNCSGQARCFTGTVITVIDGDTIKVDGKSIRFALSSAPELYEFGGEEAKELIQSTCPVGSTALVDEDDGQTQGSYGRILGVVYCNTVNLNAKLLDEGIGYLASEFCSTSEFAFTSWAQKHGCLSGESPNTEHTRENGCDPSYPDVCIPSPPPDLDCTDISYRNFRVLAPDPHKFDGDRDGIGCES